MFMDNFTKELIQAVSKRPFLHDANHNDYKNNAKKLCAWSDISDEIGGNVEVVKSKWRNLRDTYKKYKTPTAHQAAKLRNWVWAEHLHFLDGSLRMKPPGHTPPPPPPPPTTTLTSKTKTHPQQNHPGPGVAEHTRRRRRDTDDDTIRRRRIMSSQDPAEVILDYLRTKTSKQREKPADKLDKVDYLFLSYADTFKHLTPRRQALLKLDLANLFTKAELANLDDDGSVGDSHSDED